MSYPIPEQKTDLLEELAVILGVKIEVDLCFGPRLKKGEWRIWQLTENSPAGLVVDRLHAVTGLRDEDDSFVSPSPARVALVLFGIKPKPSREKPPTVCRKAFRDVAQRIADPSMTDKQRAAELGRLFDQVEGGHHD